MDSKTKKAKTVKAATKRKAPSSNVENPSSLKKKPKTLSSRISKNWTLDQLREEAACRGFDLGMVPLSKAQMLGILGDGSMSTKKVGSLLKKDPSKPAPKKPKIVAKKKASPAIKLKQAKIASKSTTGKVTAATPPKKTAAKKPKVQAKPAPAKGAAKVATKKGGPPAKPSSVKSAPVSATKKRKVSLKPAPVKSASISATKKKQLSSPKPAFVKSASIAATKKITVSPKLALVKSTSTAATKKNIDSPKPALGKRASTAMTTKNKLSQKPVLVKSTSTAATKKKQASPKPALVNEIAPLSAVKKVTVKPPKMPATPVVRETMLPRISKKMILKELREEAAARRLESKSLPKTKADLLHYLVDGSIHVLQTKVYEDYQALLKRIESERADLHQKSLENRRLAEEKQEGIREKREAKERAEREAERDEEKRSQASLHKYSYPRTHSHLLANTCELLKDGQSRAPACNSCDTYRFAPAGSSYTCEQCEWDICGACFQVQNMTPSERKRQEDKKRREDEERRVAWKKKQEELEKQREEEEAEEEARWDASKQFKPAIIKPPANNKQLETKVGKFTVWCSDGYGNDGWHSYNEPPDQEFDTNWKTAKEANDRARYLFFWKNSYGMSPDELSDEDGEPQESGCDGLKTYSVTPTDSTCWTVGVVPTSAFRHLPQTSMTRHQYDDEQEPKGWSGSPSENGYLHGSYNLAY